MPFESLSHVLQNAARKQSTRGVGGAGQKRFRDGHATDKEFEMLSVVLKDGERSLSKKREQQEKAWQYDRAEKFNLAEIKNPSRDAKKNKI